MEHDKHSAFLCSHVADGLRPVNLIAHERDHDWQFLCGEYDHGDDDCVLVCSACAFERFSDLSPYQTLEPGFLAECINGEWVISTFDH
ncbi:hypothetical protein SAMN02927928_3159 [Asticcacaulis taihuensis]|uniref:Uncharacterized protein n=1 Tax=Asticcacaulis taihuensis TaxID=260084 RepID=A0A1G4T2G8_9CAUL|nr:hypothetical protein SAMN02927928_3159 [Asticcacaulis taihuensis]